MPVPTQVPFSNTPQYPFNAAGGDLGQHGFYAPFSFQITGSGAVGIGRITASGGTVTGVACQVGAPGCGATALGTGLYSITAPAAKYAAPIFSVSTPSGVPVVAQPVYFRGDSATGLYQLRLTSPTLLGAAVYPPTGTRVDVHFMVSPASTIQRF